MEVCHPNSQNSSRLSDLLQEKNFHPTGELTLSAGHPPPRQATWFSALWKDKFNYSYVSQTLDQHGFTQIFLRTGKLYNCYQDITFSEQNTQIPHCVEQIWQSLFPPISEAQSCNLIVWDIQRNRFHFYIIQNLYRIRVTIDIDTDSLQKGENEQWVVHIFIISPFNKVPSWQHFYSMPVLRKMCTKHS